MIDIRDAAADELGAVSRLVRRSYAEYESIMTAPAWRGLRAAVEAALVDPGPAEIIVADSGEAIVGCVFLYPPAADAYRGASPRAQCSEIRLLSVDPAARGLGVARALALECIRRARLRGEREIGLHTSASMKAAIALYQSLGFERRPELDFQPPGAEVVEGHRLRIR